MRPTTTFTSFHRVLTVGSHLFSELPLFIAPHGEPETNKTRLMRHAIQQADDAESPDFDDSVPKVRGFGDVDADMLADADDFGNARMPGTDEIKRRAATERGARCFFHGRVPPLTPLCESP